MDPIELIREGKIQRYFRATRKLNVPNLVLHITQRAAGREPLFIEDDDYLAMLVLLKEVSARYALHIFVLCQITSTCYSVPQLRISMMR